MIRTNMATALAYAKCGWRVLPVHTVKNGRCTCSKGKDCTRPGKHPIPKHGVKDATTNLKAIKKWWAANPEANIGIATGKDSGVLVLDVDPRNGGVETFTAAKVKLGNLPRTPKSLTPGNGYHVLFAFPEKTVRSGSGKVLGKGVDVLSTGSYFVAPGSVGIGGSYRWAKGKSVQDLKLAKLPKAWVAALTAMPSAELAPSGGIPDGTRGTTLTSMAGTMRRGGMSEEAIAAALLAENATRVHPPLQEGEVRAIATSVCSLYPEGGNSTDPALQLVGSVLASDFAGGRHVILEQERFWVFNGTHWERVSDSWIRGKVLTAIRKFQVKGANTASLLEQSIKIMQASLAAKDDRLTGLSDRAIINTLSGELWIAETGAVELRPHCPESYLTHCLKIAYDPKAQCPQYDAAILSIFGKSESPKAMVRHWHELSGYALQPRRNIPLIVLGLGAGSNGKTSLLGILIKLLGDHLVAAQPIGTFEQNRFARFTLFGKLLLLDDDVNASTRLPDGFLKTVSEGKVLTVEEKYKSPFNFRVRTLPVLLCNTPPSLADLSYGIQRRLMVIPFEQRFKGKQKDPTLFERIAEQELAGVLNRALEGLTRLRQRGSRFLLPSDVKAANTKYITDANPLPAFLEELCVKDIKSGIYLSDFYVRFQDWCTETGITLKQQRSKVKQNLANLGYTFGRGNRGAKVMGLRFT